MKRRRVAGALLAALIFVGLRRLKQDKSQQQRQIRTCP